MYIYIIKKKNLFLSCVIYIYIQDNRSYIRKRYVTVHNPFLNKTNMKVVEKKNKTKQKEKRKKTIIQGNN